MADEDYVREVRQKLDSRVRADEEKTKKENREAEIIKDQAPKDWTRLKNWLMETVGQLNNGRIEGVLEYKSEDLDTVKITCLVGADRKETTVSFFGVIGGTINVEGSPGLSFECEVQGNKASWVMTVNKREVCSIETIGKKIINSVV